jgi:glutamyl-tRNA synthetase
MSVRVRFAPSPTGHLHVGGARTALYNYLFARSQGGTFVLRIEDTDEARSTDDSLRAILGGMRWLGLAWDEGPEAGGTHGPYFQSQRRSLYGDHVAGLVERAGAYPCWCTPGELEERRQAQVARGESPRYDGRCRRLDADAKARYVASGVPPAYRFALDPSGETAWEDVVRGTVAFRNEVLDDFVLVRSDGLPTYNFACVVDDHLMEITHVIRGDDHISNTPRQLLLYAALGWTPPHFAHASMILGADGTRLSKRHGATSVEAFRELGFVPEAMVNFLALLGWSLDGERELFDLAELERVFRLERVNPSPAVFNLEKLEWMNGQHLKRMPEAARVERVEAYLQSRGYELAGRPPEWRAHFVRAIGDRLKTLADAERYGGFALRDPVEVEADAWADVLAKPQAGPRLRALASHLREDGAFTLESLEHATRGLAAELGTRAGELMSVARVALTGRKASPGLFDVMVLLGKERVLERLEDAAARWEREAVRDRV